MKSTFNSLAQFLLIVTAVVATTGPLYSQNTGSSPYTIPGFGVRTALQISTEYGTMTMPPATFQETPPCRLISTLTADKYPAPWGGPAFGIGAAALSENVSVTGVVNGDRPPASAMNMYLTPVGPTSRKSILSGI